MLPNLNYLYDKPQVTGDLRTKQSDFVVREVLPFEPSGEGEHLLINLRKTGLNTSFVAQKLAKFFKTSDRNVTYAGLKDRFAVTEQSFGIHLPGKASDDLSGLAIDGVEVLNHCRHNKKLRTGALSGNCFEITLRNVSDNNELSRRWHAICEHGVPNYFGEQRFGINGGNIVKAKALFDGAKVKDRKKRGMYLSAARSLIFNATISHRLQNETFERPMTGDVMMLAGTQSVFKLSELDETIVQRFADKDIDITAPMWGAGSLMTNGEPHNIEQAVADEYQEFCQGLAKFGLEQERRRARLTLSDGDMRVEDNGSVVVLTFQLPAGCFATAIIRELLDYRDLTERKGDKD